MISTHDARLVPIADRIVRMVPPQNEVEDAPTSVAFPAGTSIFEQDDPSDVVYVIDDGEVDIIRVLAGGGEEPLARLGTGQYFGELGPLLGFQRSASARAATDVRLTVYGPREFRERVLHGD